MKIYIENEKRRRIFIICKNCGSYKTHYARGLCNKCYDILWQKKKLHKYEKTGTHLLSDTEREVLLTSILDKYEWTD